MFTPVGQLVGFLRAPWRWAHGRCPRCNRPLYASFPYDTAGPPGCPVCKDTTATDLRMGLWGGLAEFPVEADPLSDPEVPVGKANQ
jgi:hypothetical protein